MIRPKPETEDLLLSITEDYETLVKQTHKKAEEISDFIFTKPRGTFHFKPPTLIEGSWLKALISLEVYYSIFNIMKEINKFELYKDDFEYFPFVNSKDAVEEIANKPNK